jgi:hypothetical protein
MVGALCSAQPCPDRPATVGHSSPMERPRERLNLEARTHGTGVKDQLLMKADFLNQVVESRRLVSEIGRESKLGLLRLNAATLAEGPL